MNINFFYIILSIILYIIAPTNYNFYYILLVSLLFVLQVCNFSIPRGQGNYINFYNLFFVSYFFINFFYPLVIYPVDPEYFTIFSREFNHDLINKATALAQMSACSLILGASIVKDKSPILFKDTNKIYFDHLPVTILSIILFFLFIITVGGDFLRGNFTAQSTVSAYILPLVICSYTLATIIFFRDYKYQRNKLIFSVAIILYILLFLSIGDRGPALSLVLVIFALYSHYVKKIKLIITLPLALFGFFIMKIVGAGRTSSVLADDKNIISRGLESIDLSVDGYYAMTIDFVINAWTLYVGVEYANINGLNWGETFLKTILGVIPFLQSLVESTGLITLTSAAQIFTYIGLGNDATWGLGTNLISSIYISFGSLGCIVLFFLLGMIVEKNRNSIYISNSMISNIIYFTLVSFAVYYPRTDLMMPLKFIVWTYIIYLLLRNFKLLICHFK